MQNNGDLPNTQITGQKAIKKDSQIDKQISSKTNDPELIIAIKTDKKRENVQLKRR